MTQGPYAKTDREWQLGEIKHEQAMTAFQEKFMGPQAVSSQLSRTQNGVTGAKTYQEAKRQADLNAKQLKLIGMRQPETRGFKQQKPIPVPKFGSTTTS